MANIDFTDFEKLEKHISRMAMCGFLVKLGSKELLRLDEGSKEDLLAAFEDWYDERDDNDTNVYELVLFNDKGKKLANVNFGVNEGASNRSSGSGDFKKGNAFEFAERNQEHGWLKSENAHLQARVTELELERDELQDELDELAEGKQSPTDMIIGQIASPDDNPLKDMTMKLGYALIGALKGKQPAATHLGNAGEGFNENAVRLCRALHKFDPDIIRHLELLLTTAETDADTFQLLMKKVNALG